MEGGFTRNQSEAAKERGMIAFLLSGKKNPLAKWRPHKKFLSKGPGPFFYIREKQNFWI